MNLAAKNKQIRGELELLTKEVGALSAIYWRLQELISEGEQKNIKSSARKFVYSAFTKDEIDSFYKRKADLISKSGLESIILEIVKPKETKAQLC